MNIYINLVVLGVIGITLFAFLSFQVMNPLASFFIAVFAYVIFLLISLMNARTWLEREHDRKITHLKDRYERKIRRLKHEHDTATLEKTIRDGTKTLIKNAVDYFKIENIKNEMPPSAAIQNLQLDKYGQIIELLADFSLILPDYEENRQIVQQEIIHQIDVYQIDEKPFAEFLRTIMGKYVLTVNKKMQEKIQMDVSRTLKTCARCSERMPVSAPRCKKCGYEFKNVREINFSRSGDDPAEWLRKGNLLYRSGNLDEALRVFTLTIALDPNLDQAYYNRGVIYWKMSDFHKAVDDFQSAAQLGHGKAKAALDQISFSRTQEYRHQEVEIDDNPGG